MVTFEIVSVVYTVRRIYTNSFHPTLILQNRYTIHVGIMVSERENLFGPIELVRFFIYVA